ncbi:MAG: AraC family transcriptional regulator [Thermoanaerobaculia bacterium]
MSDREDFERRIFSYYPPLQRAREYVEKNLSQPISLRAAASAAGLEEKYFSAFFHRKTGICFRDWLAGRRVNRAIEILGQHDDTITSVAESVGFQDLRTFERSFKRLTGLTPREFKRSVAPEAPHGQAAPELPPAVVDVSEVVDAADVVNAPAGQDETFVYRRLPLYAASRPIARGLRGLEPPPVPPFLIATAAVARAPAPP